MRRRRRGASNLGRTARALVTFGPTRVGRRSRTLLWMASGKDLEHNRARDSEAIERYVSDGTGWRRTTGERVTALDDIRIWDWAASRFPRSPTPGPAFGPGGDDVSLWGKTEAQAHAWVRAYTGWDAYEIRRTARPSGGARWLLSLAVRSEGAVVASQVVADQVSEGLRVYRHVEVVTKAGGVAVDVEVGPTSDVDAVVSYTVGKLRSVLESGGLAGCPVTVVDVRCLGYP